jgi:hypothetical protein
VPSDLLPEIRAAAAEEHRAPTDLVGEASKDDIQAKIALGLGSLRQGKGLDGEAVMAELIAETLTPP